MENHHPKKKMPMGIIIILILIGIGILGQLLSTIKAPMLQFGSTLVTDSGAITVNLIMAAILAAIFYGILKKYKWAQGLGIGWYAFGMTLAVINIFSFTNNPTMFDSYYQKYFSAETAALMTAPGITIGLIMVTVFVWIFGISIIIYLATKKDYFTN